MKFSSAFLALLLVTSSAYAKSDGGFDIGGSDSAPATTNTRPLVVTHTMMANSREAAVKHSAKLFNDASDPVVGNSHGAITVVTFMDYHCPGSEIMTNNINTLLQAHPNLRVVFKEYPIHGSESLFAAKAALASIPQGKYLKFHNAIMAAGKYVSPEQVMSIAESIGLNVTQLKTDMNKKEITNKINSTHKLAKQLGLLGTPSTFFTQTDITTDSYPDSVIFMMGKFPVKDLETAIGYAER